MRRILISLITILLSVQMAHANIPTLETGTASYYSRFQDGHPTSSGERYNPAAMTAASKSFPLGSVIEVTNIRTGKSVILRVNDRGPFVRSRILDVSGAAARVLNMTHSGIARVRIILISAPGYHIHSHKSYKGADDD